MFERFQDSKRSGLAWGYKTGEPRQSGVYLHYQWSAKSASSISIPELLHSSRNQTMVERQSQNMTHARPPFSPPVQRRNFRYTYTPFIPPTTCDLSLSGLCSAFPPRDYIKPYLGSLQKGAYLGGPDGAASLP